MKQNVFKKLYCILIICAIFSLCFNIISGDVLVSPQKIIDQEYSPFITGAVDDNWPMFHHDSQHLGYSSSSAPERNSVLWSFTTGGSIRWSSPAVVDHAVYIGSTNKKVYKLNAETGEKIWEFQTNGEIWSSPAVVDGFVYIGSNDGKLYCLNDFDGVKKWEFTTSGSVKSSPVVVDAKIYFGSADTNVYCLYTSNGSKIWNTTTTAWGQSSPAVTDGRVYIGSYCLYASNGTIIYQSEIGGTYGVTDASPTVINDKIYIGSDSENTIYCLWASNGTVVWSFLSANHVRSTPAVSNGFVYVGSWAKKMYCLNMNTGAKQWEFPTGFVITSSPALADGKIYFGSWDTANPNFFCVNATTGIELWNYQFSSGIESSPAVYNDKVYIGAGDGKVYCFGNNPPGKPTQPQGSDHLIAGVISAFSTNAIIDIESDPVFYLFDWGDGSDSGWIESPTASHQWSTEGTYSVMVKAKDIYDAESSWSEELTVFIQKQPQSSLDISIEPIAVLSGGSFVVFVTSDSVPVEGATVEFQETSKLTDIHGLATLTAPTVTRDTIITIIVRTDTDLATAKLTVLKQPKPDSGWIYGIITDETGSFVSTAEVSVHISESEKRTVFSDQDGLFVISLPVGIFSLTVTKNGYVQKTIDITVEKNIAHEKNIVLSHHDAQPSGSALGKYIEYTIQKEVVDERIGARLDVHPEEPFFVSYYTDEIIIDENPVEDSISFTLSAEDGTKGTIILIYIGDGVLSDLDDIQLTYDTTILAESTDFTGFFSLADPINASWVGVLTTNGLYVFLYVPHFSEHIITISSLGDIIQILSSPLAVVIYCFIFILGVASFVVPIVFNRYRFREK